MKQGYKLELKIWLVYSIFVCLFEAWAAFSTKNKKIPTGAELCQTHVKQVQLVEAKHNFIKHLCQVRGKGQKEREKKQYIAILVKNNQILE